MCSADHEIDTSGPVDATVNEILAAALPETSMTRTDLADVYRGYIACLNERAWERLGQFVHEEAHHNGRRLGVSGYRAMLERDYREIPDLHFNVGLLISDPPFIASRLEFDCTPVGAFLGLPVNGTRVSFTENVFYEFLDGRVREVWSVIDKTAIEAQLRTAPAVATRAGAAP